MMNSLHHHHPELN